MLFSCFWTLTLDLLLPVTVALIFRPFGSAFNDRHPWPERRRAQTFGPRCVLPSSRTGAALEINIMKNTEAGKYVC
jgi:hypothetical protein